MKARAGKGQRQDKVEDKVENKDKDRGKGDSAQGGNGGGSGARGEGYFRLLPDVPALTLQAISSAGI